MKDLHTVFLPPLSTSSPGQRAGVGSRGHQVVTGGAGGGGEGGEAGGRVTLTPDTGRSFGTFGFLVVFIIVTAVIDMFVTV